MISILNTLPSDYSAYFSASYRLDDTKYDRRIVSVRLDRYVDFDYLHSFIKKIMYYKPDDIDYMGDDDIISDIIRNLLYLINDDYDEYKNVELV